MAVALPETREARPGQAGDPLVVLLARLTRRPAEAIASTSDLTADLGLDSLGRVELAALLADELGVDLDDAAVAAVGTVGELAALVAEAGGRGSGAAGRSSAAPGAGAARAGAADAADGFPRWGRAAPARWARSMLQRAVLFPLVERVCGPPRVEGLEHLRDLAAPVLLVANHTSHLDTPLLLRAVPPALRARLAVAAAADYWYARRAPAALVTLLLGAFPLARQGAVRPGLAYCGELAAAGWSVLVYPEGTRSPDGRLQPFKPGIGLLAAELGAPVVPVHLGGTHACLPRGARWPRRGQATVRFGAPLQFAPGTPAGEVAARLQAAVWALGEQA